MSCMLSGTVKMKFLTSLSSRYLKFQNVNHCRVLLIRINQSHINYSKLVKDQLQTVDALLPKLRQWLECSQEKAEEICSKLPKQEYFHVESVEELVFYLRKNGVTSEMLMDNQWLLLLPMDKLKQRVHILQKIGLSLDTIPLLRLTSKQLVIVVSQWLSEAETLLEKNKTVNRLQFLADNLHCSCYQVAMQMDRHHRLLTMDFERLARIMRRLLASGISRENIINDLWIFRHNEELICERIATATEAGVDPIKTWMLRCPEITFRNMLDNLLEMKDVLGRLKDRESYLAERLNCSKMDIVALAEKHQHMRSTKMPKVKSLLDFLFENGFTAEQIRDSPRVFGSSITTLESRLRELQKLRYPYIHLWMLHSTRKEYKRLIDKIHEANRV